jgi:hypothetical protein
VEREEAFADLCQGAGKGEEEPCSALECQAGVADATWGFEHVIKEKKASLVPRRSIQVHLLRGPSPPDAKKAAP